ncbi:ATP synthase subunit I [Pelosinus sp. sgz500959]|uniref:ATP synthase subunit I n=1 Tax=Pelosinus sp. sgz500959 TaxID=3242472 RepID=UPI0036725B5A
MQEYVIEIKRTLLHILLWGALICSGAYFLNQDWRIPGLIMGIMTSMIYFLLMCYRINKSATMSVPKAISYMRIGWLMRLAFVVLMLFLSIKIPSLDFLSAVIGLFSLQVVGILNASLLIIKSFFISSR